jgi:hypothetical protein
MEAENSPGLACQSIIFDAHEAAQIIDIWPEERVI